jgi:hypothetical protein
MNPSLVSISSPRRSPAGYGRASVPPPPAVPFAAFGPVPTERSHAALLAVCRASGGVARGDDLARLLEYLDHGDVVRLARYLGQREVFGYRWRECLWIPMFQFELRDLSVQPASRAVIADLGPGFGAWSLACWFAEANDTLDGQRPLDLLHTDLADVRAAACAFRHALAG